MALTILTEPKIQFFNNAGDPLASGKVYTYEAGTTTLKPSYTDSTGATANANPIILDAAGRANIWLSGTYKIVVHTSADVEIYTVDNVSDIGTFLEDTSEWRESGLTPTYIGATSFSLAGDQTSIFTVPRRLKFLCTAGTLYGTIISSAYTTLTTVTVIMDSGSLDAGLSEVSYGFFNYANPSIRKVPIIDHGTKSDDYALNMALADVHIIAFSAAKILTISSALTSDKSTIIIKNGNNIVTLAGIDNNSPTLTVAASKQDFITLAKSFGKISCLAYTLNLATT